MKNYFASLLLCLVLFASCKEEKEKKDDIISSEVETEKATMETSTNYKFSLAQWSLHKPFLDGSLDPMDFAQIAKEQGYAGLEYVTQLYPQIQDKSNYREKVMNLAQELKKRSDAAGMDNVLLNLFGEEDPEKWHEYSVTSLKELATYGATKGVSVLIENHGGLSSDGAALAGVMKEVGSPYCGTLPDFGNFCIKREGGERWGAPCIEEYDTYKGIAELMPFAKGVSAKSYNFDDTGAETKLDYARLMKIVADAGYKGPKEGMRLTKDLLEKSINQLQ